MHLLIAFLSRAVSIKLRRTRELVMDPSLPLSLALFRPNVCTLILDCARE